MSTTFWIQFLGVIFGIAMMYFTFVKYKRKELKSHELMMWFLGWILLMLVAIIPSSLDLIIAPLHFYRRLDFFVVFGFFILLGMGFYNYSVTKKMERKLEVLVRRRAIEENPQVEQKHEKR
ncbi:hypothetical protein COV20_03770 [Candidatus Woesearchaeota archaeon CG10_big_fil_rev_8_21_14_0_10_45_16]|nr:MAG: hypothetical protein COV20_03770 [Candidatus Woesearchaeota archaeon CG10_big_fil_rev_8_21_14_0_10_45_16]